MPTCCTEALLLRATIAHVPTLFEALPPSLQLPHHVPTLSLPTCLSEELLLRAASVKNLIGPAGAIAHELTLLEESQPSSEPQFGFESQTPQPLQRQPGADPALLQQRLAERQEQAASLERFALQAILRVMLGAEQRLCAAAVSALAAQVDKVCLMYMQGVCDTWILGSWAEPRSRLPTVAFQVGFS